ncbi:hypothetical protein [Tumidithrix helvetica]|uniref:hypothetical protein n=1 Tax=Tumidithrix helvetica TaxID=3457545 RepID=UPI003CC51D2F
MTEFRFVIDEVQNIKNPKAAQTKAILKLEAKHRRSPRLDSVYGDRSTVVA